MVEQLKNQIRLLHNEIIAQRAWHRLEEVVDPKLVYHNSFIRGRKDFPWFVRFLQELERAFPRFSMRITELKTQDDRLLCRYPFSGRHEGKFLGLPGTGIDVQVPCVALYGLRGERIHEIQVKVDMARVRQYLLQAKRRRQRSEHAA